MKQLLIKIWCISSVCTQNEVRVMHFQQYFSYIVAVSLIGGNCSTQRKPPTFSKSPTNFIT